MPEGVKLQTDRVERIEGFKVDRGVSEGVYHLSRVFKGLDASPAVARIFEGREAAERFLSQVKVEVSSSSRGYMRVSGEDGRLIVSKGFLEKGDLKTLYLDLIHELIHIKQFHNGLNLYDERYGYIDRPTEVEAYRETVMEARRLGMTDDEIYEYLRVEWVCQEDIDRLADKLGVKRSRVR